MLKNLVQKLQSLASDRDKVDPSRFADPVAMQTEWTPATGSVKDLQIKNVS
jgi:hypothetical protein